eukprot:389140_1
MNRQYTKKVKKQSLPTQKHLPNPPPARIRSKTGPHGSKKGPKRTLPEAVSPQIDNRPSLKPSLSSKRGKDVKHSKESKEQTITISLKPTLKRSSSHESVVSSHESVKSPTKRTQKASKRTHKPSQTSPEPISLNCFVQHESEEKLATPNEPIYVSPTCAEVKPKRRLKLKKTRSNPPADNVLPRPRKSGHKRD